jgi:hypothetical protein
MTEEKKNSDTRKRITEKERLSFIGFDVFPKEPKELFESDAEKEKLVAAVRARHEKHDHLRESCTLLEERVSFLDRIAVTIGAAVVFLALFLPWYSAYNEIVEEDPVVQTVEDAAVPGENPELAVAEGVVDPAAEGVVDETATATDEAAVAETPADEAAAIDESDGEGIATEEEGSYTAMEQTDDGLDGELITSLVARKSVHKEYARLSGLGGIFSIGSTASYLFSSGISLILTTILFIVFTLLCLGLPAYTLYGLYGIKGAPDERALALKKLLRFNWIPLVIFVAGMLLSFFGTEYGFNAAEKYASLGDGYSVATYLGVLSPGVYVALAGSILCAAKGAEI